MQPAPPPPPAAPPPAPPSPPSAALGAGPPARDAITAAPPRTAEELSALRERKSWLSDQLVSAQGRRKQVAAALEKAHDPVNQDGLQGRLKVLDARILQLESDIAATGQALTSAPISVAATEAATPIPDFDRGPPASVVAIVFIVCVLLPLAIAAARIFVRRFGRPAPDAEPPAAREAAQRLARLEQAVDAIAVEVERVSEGQRFVTRLLAEQRGAGETAPALPAPAYGVRAER